MQSRRLDVGQLRWDVMKRYGRLMWDTHQYGVIAMVCEFEILDGLIWSVVLETDSSDFIDENRPIIITQSSISISWHSNDLAQSRTHATKRMHRKSVDSNTMRTLEPHSFLRILSQQFIHWFYSVRPSAVTFMVISTIVRVGWLLLLFGLYNNPYSSKSQQLFSKT